MEKCPVCRRESVEIKPSNTYANISGVDCPRCGKFGIYLGARLSLEGDSYSDVFRSILSYQIRKYYSSGNRKIITEEELDIIEGMSLPKVNEQADNLIMWLGDLCKSPEELVDEEADVLASIIGAKNADGADYILSYLKDNGLITYSGILGLTVPGWNRYEELKREGIKTARAFMAMKFGDEELDSIYTNNFKKAVKQTGFDLYKLDEEPQAGLIDSRMRVEIRNSRFLLSDLTHRNPGAYWEAGFAEGLGKPVIYLCKKEIFDKEKTHFDTNHHTTIMWDKQNIKSAEEDLKIIIRATLPLEAKMTDD